MINTLDDFHQIEIRNKFEAIGFQQRDEVHESWHQGTWPKESWNQFVSQLPSFQDKDDDKRQTIVKVFSALEGWSRGNGDSSFCTSLIVHYLLCNPIIQEFFPDYEKDPNDVTCFALTESTGGSTPFDMSVKIDSSTNLVSGTKWHITNAPVCDHFLVFGKDSNSNQLAMAMVPRNQDGIIVNALPCQGMKNSPVGEISFDNAKAAKVVVSTSEVKKAIKYAFQAERLAIGFVATGIIEHHLEKLISYMRERKVGGVRIIKHQYLQKRLTDTQIELECLKSLVNCTIRSFLEGNEISAQASKIKIVAIRQVIEFANQAMKCYGSYGVQKETGLMQVLNDSMCASIAGGTEELHRNVIFSHMLRNNVLQAKPKLTKEFNTEKNKSASSAC